MSGRRRQGWWALALAAVTAWPLAAAMPRHTWDGYTRMGLEARKAGRYADAEAMLVGALRLAEADGRSGPRLASSLTNLADLYVALHRYADAEVLLRRAIAVEERRVGPGHPALASVLADHVVVLRQLGRLAELPGTEGRLRRILAAPTVRAPTWVWQRSGAGPEDLERDEDVCRRDAQYGATPYGPLIDPEGFTRCVEGRGWRKTVVHPTTEAKERQP